MVQPARPVDGNVAQPMIELDGAFNGGASIELAEVKEAIKDGAVFTHAVVPVFALEVIVPGALILYVHSGQVLDVIPVVKLRELSGIGVSRPLQQQG